MQRLKSAWKRVPHNPRRIITFVLGMLLVVSSPILGAIPGPGGMIVFLLGVAILASEFSWAERMRDYLLDLTKQAGVFFKRHPVLGGALLGIAALIVLGFAYVFYNYILYLY